MIAAMLLSWHHSGAVVSSACVEECVGGTQSKN